MAVSQLNKMTAIDLARLIAARKVSPVEAVAAAFDRVEETETQLNAFVQVDAEGARAAAGRAEADVVSGNLLGPLHGVPISVKDLIDVQGLRATYGSLSLKDAVASADSPSVERVRAAGAIIIGKTTTSECRVHPVQRVPARPLPLPVLRREVLNQSCDRSHQTMVARDVSGGTADDRCFDAALCVSRKRCHCDSERQCGAA